MKRAEQYKLYQREWKRKFYKTAKGKDTIKKIAQANVIRRRADPRRKLSHSFSGAILKSIRRQKAGYHWEHIVGYSLADLMEHLEGRFLPGMTWENYGKWHIDHVIPIAAFNFEKPTDIDFKKCWALENLSPLWATDNLCKQDHLDRPFQPSLRLSL